ncbi:MAG TPA: phosphoglycerate dehydrogenase [Blastocatellia bacterium]|nr:phosphoglycerate dehydrogenase [Blastocatellia bacterium]HAF23681.1 phosphoglycerate dehydrogenase [Blastocatellia bacterium]HCX30506.1 phosphoglycerate dehydrogenase [Blastocatellia bacterium]
MSTPQVKIFVADAVSDTGLQPLRDAGFVVEKRTGLNAAELRAALSGCAGLVVRSETKVTADLLDSATTLRVVGRAGVGVDNIDVPAATERGIVVMNAPDGNTITTAEHTIALLIALARRIPQANSSLKSGHWDRKSFIGVELQGKTLGVVGMGRIGRVVAARARAFGMRILAFDPFLAPEQARDLEIELAPLEDVFANADFLTVHTPLTPETRGIIGRDAFAKMKQGVRVINCARGGLVDESALCDAIKSGAVAGAALDVFANEPPASDHPLLLLDEVIVTPHLGASTTEAQEGVAFTVAEQMRDYLLSGALRGAVNVPALGVKELGVLRPYIELAEKLGRFQAQLVDSAVREVKLEFAGEIVELNAAPVTRSFLAGLLRDVSARVNAVNAFLIAEERGIKVTTTYFRAGADLAPAIRTHVLAGGGEQSVAGTIFGFGEQSREGRITEIDGFHIEAIPQGHMLVMRNRDVPGVIGRVGTILGERGVNISRFHLGRQERGGEAMAVIEVDASLERETLAALRARPEILTVREIELV